VHLVNPTFLGLAGLRASRRLGIPVIASYHTDMSGFAREWRLGLVSQPIHDYYRWIHNQCDLNLAASNWTKNELIELGYRRMDVWRGGIDVDLYTPSKRTMAWRVNLTRGEARKPLVITVSRLSREKRIELLLPLMKELPDIFLVVIGDGPYRNELIKMFEGTSTVFTGYLQGEELAHAYAAGDIFVFNGKHETFGNVVIEAMASGLPVVVPNSGGVTDLVTHGVNGLLYPADDHRGMVESVRYLLQNRGEALQMGMAGRSIAEGRTWETTLDEVIGFYEQVVSPGEIISQEAEEKIVLPQAWQQFIQDIESRVFPR
jgi:phosphatidylinositol alpha 1,6-mannosyltransferase